MRESYAGQQEIFATSVRNWESWAQHENSDFRAGPNFPRSTIIRKRTPNYDLHSIILKIYTI